MKKLKAFTLVELAIVMLISIILFGVAYFSWRIIQQKFDKYSNSALETEDLSILQFQLNQDFKNSQHVLAASNIKGLVIDCVFDSLIIRYLITKENVQRSQGTRIDTFKVIPQRTKVFQLNNEIYSLPAVIDEISFETVYKEEVLHFSSKKKYSASDLINNSF